MFIHEDKEAKVIEIWLDKDESDSKVINTELNNKIAGYKLANNLVVVFRSGRTDINQTLNALVQANI